MTVEGASLVAPAEGNPGPNAGAAGPVALQRERICSGAWTSPRRGGRGGDRLTHKGGGTSAHAGRVDRPAGVGLEAGSEARQAGQEARLIVPEERWAGEVSVLLSARSITP